MSLFAGTGFFTQSAVLFPTFIEKNKKTEACSRDPQASSLLHGKGRHRQPFFTRGGRKTLLAGEGGPGLRNRSAGLHLPCKSAGNNRPPMRAGLGEPEKDAGTALMGAPLLALIPEQTPNVLIQVGRWGTHLHLVPACSTSCCSVHGVLGNLDQDVEEHTPALLISSLCRAPQFSAVWGHVLTRHL